MKEGSVVAIVVAGIGAVGLVGAALISNNQRVSVEVAPVAVSSIVGSIQTSAPTAAALESTTTGTTYLPTYNFTHYRAAYYPDCDGRQSSDTIEPDTVFAMYGPCNLLLRASSGSPIFLDVDHHTLGRLGTKWQYAPEGTETLGVAPDDTTVHLEYKLCYGRGDPSIGQCQFVMPTNMK